MTTTLERTGTTRPPDGLAPAAASTPRKSWAVAPRGGGAAGTSSITAPSPDLAVHPSRDGSGREPGDPELQETGGGAPTKTTSPLPARVHSRRVAGRVAHEPSVPARALPVVRTRNARAGSPPASHRTEAGCPTRAPCSGTAHSLRASRWSPRGPPPPAAVTLCRPGRRARARDGGRPRENPLAPSLPPVRATREPLTRTSSGPKRSSWGA